MTVKVRYIRVDAGLPEDLWPECYVAAAYLADRTPTAALSWDSSLTYSQKALGESIRPEISHLRVYGCKAYVLLKESEAPGKSHKLMPRAFAGYLVGYNSTNIYRIWNPATYTVKGYHNIIFDKNKRFHPGAEMPQKETEPQLKIVEIHLPNYLTSITDTEEELLIQLPSQRNKSNKQPLS